MPQVEMTDHSYPSWRHTQEDGIYLQGSTIPSRKRKRGLHTLLDHAEPQACNYATHQGDALVMEELNTVNKPAEPMVSDSGWPLGHWAKLLKMSPTHKKMVEIVGHVCVLSWLLHDQRK